MTTKLTLSIDKKVIVKSKKYAATQNRSLSDLVESYLRSLTQNSGTSSLVTDKVKRLQGSIKAPSGFDYKKILQEEILRKHG
jgi:hypothetical protein